MRRVEEFREKYGENESSTELLDVSPRSMDVNVNGQMAKANSE